MIRSGGLEIHALVLRPRHPETFPINWAYLPLDPGLSVLYGLNGAGKSMVLDCLRACAAGRTSERTQRSGAGLIISLTEDALRDSPLGPNHDHNAHSLFASLFPPHQDSWVFDGDEEVGNHFRERFSWCLTNHRVSDQIAEDVFEEWWQRRWLLISPEGGHTSGWSAVPLVRVSPDGPAAHAALEEWRTSQDALGRSRRGEPPLGRLVPPFALVDEMDPMRRLAELTPPGSAPSVVEALAFSTVTDHESWPISGLSLPILDPAERDADRVTSASLEQIARHQIGPISTVDAASVDATKGRPTLEAAVSAFRLADEVVRDGTLRQYLDHLASESTADWVTVLPGGGLSPESGIAVIARLLEVRANAVYQWLLLGAPELRLRLRGPREWVLGQTPRWEASTAPELPWVPISQLSSAERRWAEIAVHIALHFPEPGLDHDGGILLIDEPEAAVHRTAEVHMAAGLAEIANLFSVIAATHSPEVLNAERARVWRVSRHDQHDGMGSQIQELQQPTLEMMAGLGLRPGDLLGLYRGFLVVEGWNDVFVFDELLGSQLRERRVRILPANGARDLAHVVDAPLLADLGGYVFTVVDDGDATVLNRTWEEAKAALGAGGYNAALHVLQWGPIGDPEKKRMSPNKQPKSPTNQQQSDRYHFIRSYLIQVLKTPAQVDRHFAFGLTKKDVIDYLPTRFFVGTETSWETLRLQCESELREKGMTFKESAFKDWYTAMGRRSGVVSPRSEENIRAAARSLVDTPEDFARILSRIDEAFSPMLEIMKPSPERN